MTYNKRDSNLLSPHVHQHMLLQVSVSSWPSDLNKDNEIRKLTAITFDLHSDKSHRGTHSNVKVVMLLLLFVYILFTLKDITFINCIWLLEAVHLEHFLYLWLNDWWKQKSRDIFWFLKHEELTLTSLEIWHSLILVFLHMIQSLSVVFALVVPMTLISKYTKYAYDWFYFARFYRENTKKVDKNCAQELEATPNLVIFFPLVQLSHPP